MATYTPNYGLHQWVPEDNFLRMDFNEDFQKIDTALAEMESSKADSGSTSTQISSINSAISDLEARDRVMVGMYTGDGKATKDIELGLSPKAVLVESPHGMRSGSGTGSYGGMATGQQNCHNGIHVIISTYYDGFQVWQESGYAQLNVQNQIYRYLVVY